MISTNLAKNGRPAHFQTLKTMSSFLNLYKKEAPSWKGLHNMTDFHDFYILSLKPQNDPGKKKNGREQNPPIYR